MRDILGAFFVPGLVFPIAVLSIALLLPVALPVLLALAGLFAFEHCFVVAGQVMYRRENAYAKDAFHQS